MKYNINLGKIRIKVDTVQGGGSLVSGLKDPCTVCGNIDCYECPEYDKDDKDSRRFYNNAMDGVESLLLALACDGVNIGTKQFKNAIQTSVEAIGNQC